MQQATRDVVLAATIEEVAGETVAETIGIGRYGAIKQRDEHPMFVKLKIGYEGISRGVVTVAGRTVSQAKRWFRAVIDELAEVFNFGDPGLFEGHENKAERPRLGDVVAAFSEDDTNGRRQATAIAYVRDLDVRPRIKRGELSGCSVEAEVLIGGLDTEEPYVQAVERAKAVVLAPPGRTPGFEEAGVEAVIAELQRVEMGEIDEMNDNKPDTRGKKPSELFSRNELLEDEGVRALIDAGRTNQYRELTDAKAEIEKLKEDAKKGSETIADLTKKLKDAGGAVNAGRVTDILKKKVDALKLSKSEKTLISDRLTKSIRVEDPDISDEDLETLIETEVKEAGTDALAWRKVYGKKDDDMKDEVPSDETEEGDNGDKDGEKDPFLAENKLTAKDVA